MTTGFSTATDWLSNISGPNAQTQIEKKDKTLDPILRDLRDMKDAETKGGVHSSAPPKYNSRGIPSHSGRAPMPQQQPKPKFVAHKDPTQGKKGKDKAKSNRLGTSMA